MRAISQGRGLVLLLPPTTVVVLATPYWPCTAPSYHSIQQAPSYSRYESTHFRTLDWEVRCGTTNRQRNAEKGIASLFLSIVNLSPCHCTHGDRHTHRVNTTPAFHSGRPQLLASHRIADALPITNALIIRRLRGSRRHCLALPFQRFSACSSRPSGTRVASLETAQLRYAVFLGSILAKLVIKFSFVPGPELFMRPLDGYDDTRALGR
jgi:hypothetical protein